ncbi:hypothetical protein AALP_AA2G195100 [Arabis alpina]|uniref:J domain-containing protein n=1 Tax=Arabis alpina TaxID=50452 RepID=A0A087HIL4_ARAAL|nr:hypothetical protein AALP_AA2G195100 [Arabis alpina]
MEYEKAPTATTFSRKMSSNRSHSLSFNANAVYDGVFGSPVNTKSPMVDYGEIFRCSGPSPSSIPFLDVPELNGGKIKVDVRSSKLDYASVFGGFGDCDFVATPKEVIVKSEKKRNRRKGGNSCDVPVCKEEKNRISSPEMVRMKHSDISYQQAVPRNENGSSHHSQVPIVASPTQVVGNTSPVQKIESKPPVALVEKKPGDVGVEEVKATRKRSSKTEVDFAEVFGRNGGSTCDDFPSKNDSSGEHRDVKSPSSLQRTFIGENGASERLISSKSGFSEMFQNGVSTRDSLPSKNDSNAELRDVKQPSSLQSTLIGENGASERFTSSKPGISERFQNGGSTRDNFPSKTDSSAEHRDVKPPSVLQPTFIGENRASETLTSSKSGISEQTEDDDSPSSPTYFDAETDVNSDAAESSAALKKAIDEAQLRMNIAKQMMERKKSGFRSSAKLKSCDDPEVENKVDKKVERITEESRDNNSQILGELVNTSEQSSSNEGDQLAKRARKLWGVPEGLLKSNPDDKRDEVEEQEAVKLEEEQARRGRKHWDLPGEIFKSVLNSKQQEAENLVPAKPEIDTKREAQPLTENPFYTFGQLGSKLKYVVEAFTGSKVSQKDETEVKEKENSTLTEIFQDVESDSQEMLAGIPVMETLLREVEETLQQTESKSEIKIDDNSESTLCTSTERFSDKMEEETEWEVKSTCESEGGPMCGVKDVQENSDSTYNFLDQEGDKEIVCGTQEMSVGHDDNKTYVREVEEIPTPYQSLSKTQLEDSVGTMVSFHTGNASEPGNIQDEKETEHKAPRRRRVWQTSEDVYNIIKAPKENNRPWQLESVERETTERSFQVEGVRIHDASEETESTSGQASDSGMQENWTVLKQMFRQMFQPADTKAEDETYCIVESEKDRIDIHQKARDENGKETAETSYCQMTGTDNYVDNEAETVETEYEAYAHIRENEDSETFCRKEDGKVEVQSKTSLVRELIGEELEPIGMASDQESEDVQDVCEQAGWAQELPELDEIDEHADSRAETLEYDRSETDSNISGEKFEQTRELADETKIDGSIDTDTSRSSFEMRQGDSYIEEVGVEEDLSDQFHEKDSAASSTEEHVEEIDSDSIQSGWSVVEDEDKIKAYVEESLAGHLHEEGASKPEEMEEIKEETDEMKTSLDVENDEDKTEQEDGFECRTEDIDRSNEEPAESSCGLPKGDEKSGAADRNMKDNEGEESCRSSMEEEGDATSDASQNEAERAEKHLKKKNEAKEKERERVMVERAIREARERAFADAKERAGKAAMEKAKAGAHRKGTSEVPRRSEKGSVEVNDKLSSAEKASMQAKLRSERAAVERALSEARERALEKALSGKSATSQTRVYGGSKSFGTSGERRGSSSSGTENKNSGPSSSSNQTAKGEPIQRCKARSERHQRTSDRAAEALAEKKLRDLKANKEQTERNKLADSLDADVKRWSSGKENNLRALLSTLQYILGAESGWKPIPLTDLVSSAAVRKAYRKATLYVHPDKLQQRGASTQQKYICEKVFDLLKEAWNKFGADER